MYSDFGALATLRTEARQDSAAAMDEVAGQFESLFVQMMLKSMRDATEKGGLFDSHQLDSYQQMYDQQIALELSKNGGVGLAEVIVQQFQGQQAVQAEEGVAETTELRPLSNFRVPSLAYQTSRASALGLQSDAHTAPLASAHGGMSPPPKADWSAADPDDFVRSLTPYAEQAGERLGVDPQVLLAQAALETGWGKHVIQDGARSSNNFFNIKAGGDWSGDTVSVTTLEYRDGVAVREQARFRAYPSAEAAFDDYADFIGGKARYADALAAAGDAQAYVRELQRAGYATDPAYADKIIALHERLPAAPVELALKNSPSGSITD